MINAYVAFAVYGWTAVRASLTRSRSKRFRLWCECEKRITRLAN